MKICEVSSGHIPIPPVGAGALEKIVLALSAELGKRGHEVYIVDVATSIEFERPLNVLFRRAPNLGLPNRGLAQIIRGIYFMFASSYLVGGLVRAGNADVIHIHSQFSGFLILILNKFFWKKPLVFTTHNQEIFEPGLRKRAFSWPERFILRHVETVVCVSPTVRQLLMARFGLDENRLVQIYSGVELEMHGPRRDKGGDGALKIITVARIARRKNQLMVLEAAKEVVKTFPDARFYFIGPLDDAAYHEQMKKLTADYGLEEHVCFCGEVDASALEAAYASADLFVLTSTNENQGLVILEAMAHSVPVICSSIGPFTDMIAGEEGSATTVNSESELIAAIVDLLSNPSKRERQLSSATRLVEKFQWSYVAAQYEALFANRSP